MTQTASKQCITGAQETVWLPACPVLIPWQLFPVSEEGKTLAWWLFGSSGSDPSYVPR